MNRRPSFPGYLAWTSGLGVLISAGWGGIHAYYHVRVERAVSELKTKYVHADCRCIAGTSHLAHREDSNLGCRAVPLLIREFLQFRNGEERYCWLYGWEIASQLAAICGVPPGVDPDDHDALVRHAEAWWQRHSGAHLWFPWLKCAGHRDRQGLSASSIPIPGSGHPDRPYRMGHVPASP